MWHSLVAIGGATSEIRRRKKKKETSAVKHNGLRGSYRWRVAITRMRGKAQRDGRPRGALKLRRYSLLFLDQSTPDLTQFLQRHCSLQCGFPIDVDIRPRHDMSKNTLTFANFRILISKNVLGFLSPPGNVLVSVSYSLAFVYYYLTPVKMC